MEDCPEIFGSANHFDRLLNKLRKWRTLSLKIAFPILIIDNILRGKKPHELLPGDRISAMAVVGMILVIVGALLRFWARGHFLKGQLFTTGPYKVVRHPLYLGSLLIVIGVLFQLNGWLNWIVIIPLFAIFYGTSIVYEEKSLAKRFGKEWQEYKLTVPAFIPSTRKLFTVKKQQNWRWKTYLKTGELTTTVLVLSVPWLIEALEEFIFEGLLHV